MVDLIIEMTAKRLRQLNTGARLTARERRLVYREGGTWKAKTSKHRRASRARTRRRRQAAQDRRRNP